MLLVKQTGCQKCRAYIGNSRKRFTMYQQPSQQTTQQPSSQPPPEKPSKEKKDWGEEIGVAIYVGIVTGAAVGIITTIANSHLDWIITPITKFFWWLFSFNIHAHIFDFLYMICNLVGFQPDQTFFISVCVLECIAIGMTILIATPKIVIGMLREMST
jgi:hypothetical protein